MISDVYSDEIAQMLYEAGYTPGYIGDIQPRSEIAIMHRQYDDGEIREVVEFSTVLDRIDRTELRPEGSHVVRFIAQSEKGFPKHHTYNSSWGIYIRPTAILDESHLIERT